MNPRRPDEREIGALADAEQVPAGEVIRIRTTGGGGWGDPLARPYEEVARDVAWGNVSVAGAREDYGVVMDGDRVALTASDALRAALIRRRTADEPFFDRGPGYARLSGGRTCTEVDPV